MMRLAVVALGVAICGCGTESESDTLATSEPFSTGQSGTSSDSNDESSSEGSSGGATGSSTDLSAGSSSSGDDPTMPPTTDPVTTGQPDPSTPCDPDFARFSGEPLDAAISIDVAGSTCMAHEGIEPSAQLQLTVRPTGLVDVAATGVSIDTSSHGTYINETAVTNITTDVEVTLELTDDGGTPLSVIFTFSSVGPSLSGVAAVY